MSVPDAGGNGHKIGLVLAGGGARGAYELGVLRRLLPWLAARLKQEPGWPDDIDVETWRPHIIVGTSVGALNAAYLAATADEPLEQALDDGCKVWQQITWGKALANLVSLSSVRTSVSTLLDLTKVPGFHADRVLDPSPLRKTLTEGPLIEGRQGGLPFDRIRRNLRELDQLEAAAVVTTLSTTSLSQVFYDGRMAQPAGSKRRGLAYTKTHLDVDHVLASAAIPSVFPPVYVESAGAWYYDGGTRLNTPIKPALDLGATHLIVVALHSPRLDEVSDEDRKPDVVDGAKQLIQGLLIDPLVNDLHTLADINGIVSTMPDHLVQVPADPPARPEYKQYREIPYIFVGPSHREIGRCAYEVFDEHYDDVWDLRHNVAIMGQGLDVDHDSSRGELLSYLFFDKHFGAKLVDLGGANATDWINRVEGNKLPLWQTGPPAP
jgi:NTE family protein